ncbi:MAG: ribonuclease III [Candidatus Uhrbacteria bacterium]|nr:ribonuclease III [Candidatus Uhrbacteria bacterium]
MMQKDIAELAKMLGIPYKPDGHLEQAMVHRSYLNEHPDFPLAHNERLEFLGDAVLELVVTEYLYNNYENPEGELTTWRSSLVNGDSLAGIASELNVEPYLYLSRGEEKDANSKARRYILANAMEAIIGAVYLDFGWEVSKDFVSKTVVVKLADIIAKRLYIDPKSRFQEAAQSRMSVTPSYKVLEESGPDHNKIFRIGVYLGKEFIAEGAGSSKQEAQIAAAEAGINAKGW